MLNAAAEQDAPPPWVGARRGSGLEHLLAEGEGDGFGAVRHAEARQTIQDAIDAAVPTQGTVTLGNGLFDIDAQLMVTGGVTLVGQGWESTTIRFAGTKAGNDNRVVNISGGVVSHVTLTGGKVDNNYKSGGGAFITDGRIS